MPRDLNGRIVSKDCPECDCGQLQFEPDRIASPSGQHGWWRCDGLTHLTPESPLIACEYSVEGIQP